MSSDRIGEYLAQFNQARNQILEQIKRSIVGQSDVLESYQRWRRFDTMAMGVATNSLNLLFSNKSTLLRTVRDIGLGLVDRAPPLKEMFIRQAAGLSGEVPRLLKGEAL